MHPSPKAGIAALLSILLFLGGNPALVWSAEDEGDQLKIGIPDFPRRVTRTVQEADKERAVKVGIVKLHPSFIEKVEYDDNIRLSESDDADDVIFTETPAMGVEMDLGDHHFEGAYGMEIVNFVKFQEENAINHLANAALDLNFNDLSFSIKDVLEKSTSRLFTETSARDTVLINTVEVLARYDRPKWAAETGWRHNTIDHRKDILDTRDYEEDILAMLAGYKILPKTLFLVETDIGQVRYDDAGNANQEYWQILGGFRGEPTEKLTLTAKIGFQDRKVGDVPGRGPQSNYTGVVADSDFLYNFSDNESARIGYTRTVRTSTYGDNSWYRQDKISASYRKRFLRKWIATPRLGWQMNDYPERVVSFGSNRMRRDNFWQAGFELRYEIQEWLSTGVAYRFRSRTSNVPEFEFENNRFSFDITFAY